MDTFSDDVFGAAGATERRLRGRQFRRALVHRGLRQ